MGSEAPPGADHPGGSASSDPDGASEIAGLRSILDTAGEGIIVADEHGLVELYNAKAQEIRGWAPEEGLGQGLDRFVTEGREDQVDDFVGGLYDDGLGLDGSEHVRNIRVLKCKGLLLVPEILRFLEISCDFGSF